jgi:predicted RNase H-related nuclease YkuK (DUF458 family)
MNHVWKKINGQVIDNLAKYIKDYISQHPGEYEIFVGTDSQRIRKKDTVLFAMVICLYRQHKGAHIIYAKHKRTDKKFKDKLVRLRTEVEYSINIANYLVENEVIYDNDIMTIHIDISPNKKNASNSIYQEAVGWIKGMGYLVEAKPNAPGASYASDWIVKNKHIAFN